MTMSQFVGDATRGMWVHFAGTDTATVRLVGTELDATVTVSALECAGFDGLADYFAGLGRDWRGWTGIRTWRSREGELTLASRHDGRVHITCD